MCYWCSHTHTHTVLEVTVAIAVSLILFRLIWEVADGRCVLRTNAVAILIHLRSVLNSRKQ